ncbi:hypothetical protein GH733_013594 [Mirounga leonina]|nr:hypothetical protein GH733_013594 [Mirounga leonina]
MRTCFPDLGQSGFQFMEKPEPWLPFHLWECSPSLGEVVLTRPSKCEQSFLERMPSSPALIFMVIFFLESLAAVLQNGFIVTVLGREWV